MFPTTVSSLNATRISRGYDALLAVRFHWSDTPLLQGNGSDPCGATGATGERRLVTSGSVYGCCLGPTQPQGSSCAGVEKGGCSPPTAVPTATPTASPTTLNPTTSPTVSPTTSDPTTSPSTADPTTSPSTSPTIPTPALSKQDAPEGPGPLVVAATVGTVAVVGIVLAVVWRLCMPTRKQRPAVMTPPTAMGTFGPGNDPADDPLLGIGGFTLEDTRAEMGWQPPPVTPAALTETQLGNEAVTAVLPSHAASTLPAHVRDDLPDVSTMAGMAVIVTGITSDWADGSRLGPHLKTLPVIGKSRLRFSSVIGNGAHGKVWRAACGAGTSSLPSEVAIKTSTSVSSRAVRQRRHRFEAISRGFLSSYHPPHVVMYGTWRPCVSDADRCLQSDAIPDIRLQLLLREAALLAQLDHEHVTPVLGVSTGLDHAYVVLPLAEWGSLADTLRRGILKQRPALRCRAAAQVAAGMAHLAAAGVVHRDISARNVLVFGGYVFKISDLGLGLRVRGANGAKVYYRNRPGAMPIKWLAPEAIHSGRFSPASDVYSFGMLLYEVWTDGAELYAGVSARGIVEMLSASIRLPQPPACGNAVYSIMLACWRNDPAARPPMVEIERTFVALYGRGEAGVDVGSLVGGGGDPGHFVSTV